MSGDQTTRPRPVARLRAFFERAFISQMSVAAPAKFGRVRDRGKGRPGNGGHPNLASLHADIARREQRRERREAEGRWAP